MPPSDSHSLSVYSLHVFYDYDVMLFVAHDPLTTTNNEETLSAQFSKNSEADNSKYIGNFDEMFPLLSIAGSNLPTYYKGVTWCEYIKYLSLTD